MYKGKSLFWSSEIDKIEDMIHSRHLDDLPNGMVPIDYPYKGNIIPLQRGQSEVHGFYIENSSDIFDDDLFFVENVHHNRNSIRISREKTKIMAHLLQDTDEPIEVKIIDKDEMVSW